jgi:hypothetical protein
MHCKKGGEESSQDSLYSAILSDAVFFAEAIQGDLDLVFSQFVLPVGNHFVYCPPRPPEPHGLLHHRIVAEIIHGVVAYRFLGSNGSEEKENEMQKGNAQTVSPVLS